MYSLQTGPSPSSAEEAAQQHSVQKKTKLVGAFSCGVGRASAGAGEGEGEGEGKKSRDFNGLSCVRYFGTQQSASESSGIWRSSKKKKKIIDEAMMHYSFHVCDSIRNENKPLP
ncbi:hypothetical protein CJ030_MR1G017994 [Morella rubra]|uniref:Uncharacterized protein n=1 Tax=Morella rubra TaxID=262757 RepID=A0A6A1WMQ2_9ROSI|nr:hypothetical protein CJ030_MR1G017994 [Morella rubra]